MMSALSTGEVNQPRQSEQRIRPLEQKRADSQVPAVRYPLMNNNALVFALKKLVSKAHNSTRAIPSKTFIWLPFAGGISAFAVILPKPHGKLLKGWRQ
jgi:hypothetical protein